MNNKMLSNIKYGFFIFFLFYVSGLEHAFGQSSNYIGQVTAVQRVVLVTHPNQPKSEQVKLAGDVLFKDIFETKREARLKVLFDDDSILNLGELTRVQITENVYSPGENKRSTVIELLKGTLRTLVGKVFGGSGSKFEVHTPTAVAAARGTYFIVWTLESGKKVTSGIVNIGETGIVDVKNKDSKISGSVALRRNQYTQVEAGKAPTPPATIDLVQLQGLIRNTEIKDQAKEDIPKGMNAPGSEVTAEGVSPVIRDKGDGEVLGPAIGAFLFPDEEKGRMTQFPTVPPIQQQPRTESSTTSVNVSF